ncbi:hypothetical protein EVAR_34528_1 [Eumeta japonica]|uniref:Uncharacterized protein n=1 Tax=Eumeta variegata TaxID=151549 RepID=A0A4C1X461_EUMVA|nr:hypothetical protein EVAR_34528_1 [Eumeta japonica]
METLTTAAFLNVSIPRIKPKPGTIHIIYGLHRGPFSSTPDGGVPTSGRKLGSGQQPTTVRIPAIALRRAPCARRGRISGPGGAAASRRPPHGRLCGFIRFSATVNSEGKMALKIRICYKSAFAGFSISIE